MLADWSSSADPDNRPQIETLNPVYRVVFSKPLNKTVGYGDFGVSSVSDMGNGLIGGKVVALQTIAVLIRLSVTLFRRPQAPPADTFAILGAKRPER